MAEKIAPACVIHHADAREVIPTLSSPLYVLTDPPYGIGLMSHGGTVRRGDRPVFRGKRLIPGDEDGQVGGEVLDLCHLREWAVASFANPLKPWPGSWRQHLIWDKGEAVGIGGDRETCWKFNWELIQVGRFPRVFGSRDSSILHYPVTPDNYDDHPAAKPLKLMRYLIKKLVPEGATVLDPFMGSGRTGLACLQTGRGFIGIEIDPTYYATAHRLLSHAQSAGLFAAGQQSLWE